MFDVCVCDVCVCVCVCVYVYYMMGVDAVGAAGEDSGVRCCIAYLNVFSTLTNVPHARAHTHIHTHMLAY